jgi:Lrp/AsnC family leucine-responsive transcriptional regulator
MTKLLMNDDLNRRLVVLLQQEGRISHAELAERLGVSRPTVIDRVKRLEAEGEPGLRPETQCLLRRRSAPDRR